MTTDATKDDEAPLPDPDALLRVAETAANGRDPERALANARLVAQRSAIRATVEHAIATQPDTALRLVVALRRLWPRLGLADDALSLTRAAVDASASRPSATHAMAVAVLAELVTWSDDAGETPGLCARAIEEARATRSDGAASLAHAVLAGLAWRSGDLGAMETEATRAIELGRGDETVFATAVHLWALAAKARGDVDTARSRFAESIAFGERTGDDALVAVEHANRADLAFSAGDDRGAARDYGEAVRRYESLDRPGELPFILPWLAAIAARRGDDENAGRLMGIATAAGGIDDADRDDAWALPVEAASRRSAAFERARDAAAAMPVADAWPAVRGIIDQLARNAD